MPWSATISSTERALDAHPDLTAEPGSLYFTAFSTRLPSADTSWRRSPTHPHAGRHARGSSTSIRRSSASGRTRSIAPVDDVEHVDEIADRLLAELDAGQLQQVVDRAGDAVRLVDHPRRRCAGRLASRSSSSASVSASTASAPTGVFSSWLMLATKSVRTASTRRRSLMSSIVAIAPPPGSGEAATTTATRGGP